jgi:spore coat protein H
MRTRTSVLLLLSIVAELFAEQKNRKLDVSAAVFTNVLSATLRIRLHEPACAALRVEARTYVKGTVSEGQRVYDDVGVHLKGQYGTFQTIDGHPSLTLNFDKFIHGQKFHGMEKFHLNNSVSDPSFITELLCADLFRAAGVPASRVTHARVELNGRDLGLYVLVEGHDKTFLRRHFSDPHGNLYESGFCRDITEPLKKASGDGPDDYTDLHALDNVCHEPDPHVRLTKLASLMDMDRFYTTLALESMMRHFDGYTMSVNNYWLYCNPEPQPISPALFPDRGEGATNGKFVFIPYGMDQMFWDPQAALLPDPKGRVARSVLYTAEGRAIFRERCGVLLTNLLEYVTNHIADLHSRLLPAVTELGTNAVQTHERAVVGLHQRVLERLVHLREELAAPPLRPIVIQPNAKALLTNWSFSVEKGKAVVISTVASSNNAPLSFSPLGVEMGLAHPNGDEVAKANSLRMWLEGETFATWQGRVLLPQGVYRVSGRVSTDQPTFRGPACPVTLRIYGLEDVQLETATKDARHAEMTCVFVMPHASPEEAVIQWRAQSTAQRQSYTFDTLTLTRLQ